MAAIEPKYKCNKCDKLYDFEEDAIDCWRNCIAADVHVLEIYICPLCRDEHKNEETALGCCGYDPDRPPPPPSAEELEDAGQIRLLP